jgi:hypothetical protein
MPEFPIDFGRDAALTGFHDMTRFHPLLLILLALAVGCAATVQPGPTAPSASPGYALLDQLMGQEKDVSKILIIKDADAPISTLIKEIAAASDIAADKLQDFARQDAALNLKDTGLPDIEIRTRDAIASTQTHELLFNSGRNFEARLLFTQADAMNYAAHLAKVLNETEKDPARKQFLADLEKQSTDFYARILALLANK